MEKWLPLILNIATCLIFIGMNWGYFKGKVEDLQGKNGELKENHNKLERVVEDNTGELRDAIESTNKQLAEVVTLMKASLAEQAIINKFTAGILATLTDKTDKTLAMSTENAGSIKLLHELYNRIHQ